MTTIKTRVRNTTTAALLLAFVHLSGHAQGPAPGHPQQTPAHAEIIAPVEPRREDMLPHSAATPLAAPMTALLSDCDMDGYANLSGQDLVAHILDSPGNCIDNLYTGNATSFAAFTRERMIAVANAAAVMAISYSADAGDTRINKLYYFLRTGYYIEYYYPDQVPSFDSGVQSAVNHALARFIANSDFYTASDSHGQAIVDAIILMDSAGEQARYLSVAKEWLARWSPEHAQHRNLRSAVNGLFTLLFRGHYQADFVQAAGSDPQLMQRLGNFARSDWMLNSPALFMQENAARELSRFLQYPDAPAFPTAVDEVAQLLDRYSATGTGSSVWLLAASGADYYGLCEEFSICGFWEDLEQQVLSDRHTCSDSLRIHAQDMTQQQMHHACDLMAQQEIHFHQLLATNHNPVADDYNTSLEVVVFDDWYEYNTYAPFFYGINTDNGGIYLEGNPANPDNQARFIAHEADWLRPEFEIWNLTHEHVHYLDGRYNLYGGFGDARTGTHKTVWWIEGLAEYVSKKNFNDSAIALARTGQYQLSQVFSSTYNSGSELVYRWSYLAVRFMFERHHNDVTQMLTYLRAGNYDGYLNYINAIGTSYDSEWQSWLTQVQSSEDEGEVNACIDATPLEYGQIELNSPTCLAGGGSIRYFYIFVPAATQSLEISLSGGSGDADLYVNASAWATADNYDQSSTGPDNHEHLIVTAPPAGWYYISLIGSEFSETSIQVQTH